MPIDSFDAHQCGLESPAERHAAITPSDTLPVDPRPRALWCQTAGDLVIEDRWGTQLSYAVQPGQVLPFRASKVLATGTTATVYGWD